MLKKEVRVIAWDDCAFTFRQKKVLLVGAVFRGGQFLDGLLSTRIEKDGLDATEKIRASITGSRHRDQLSFIMLNGLTFGGFNVVDIGKLHNETGVPVIVVQRDKPDLKKFMFAMKRLGNYSARRKAVKNAGPIRRHGKIYFQKAGLPEKECRYLLKLTCTRSNVPEPLRVAHLIASGLSRKHAGGFESRGRA